MKIALIKGTFTQLNFISLALNYIPEKTNQILKNKTENIVYPREAYSYELELINAGMNHLSFHNIIVRELREDSNQAYEATQYIDPKKKLKVINQIITNIRTHHLDSSNYHRSDMNG